MSDFERFFRGLGKVMLLPFVVLTGVILVGLLIGIAVLSPAILATILIVICLFSLPAFIYGWKSRK